MKTENQNLVSIAQIIKETNVLPSEFKAWKTYGFIPKYVKKIGSGRGKGFEYFYPQSIIGDIRIINNLKKQGWKFRKIKEVIKAFHKTGMAPQEIILRGVMESDLPEAKGKKFTTEKLFEMWKNKSRHEYTSPIQANKSKIIKKGKTQNIPRLTIRKRITRVIHRKQKKNNDSASDDDSGSTHFLNREKFCSYLTGDLRTPVFYCW